MGGSSKPIQNFAGGEASPKLRGRTDVVPYFACAETLENVLVTHYGSALRTPGTRHVARLKLQAKPAKLIPFIFSTGQSYILEFGNLYMRVYQDGGSVTETAINISGITKADPAVVTVSGVAPANGKFVDISGVVGMTQVNSKRYIVANRTSTTFELTDEDGNNVNSSGYTTYSSAGIVEVVYEIATPWDETQVPDLKFTQQADVMYLVHPSITPRVLSRLSSTSWTLAEIAYDTFDYPPFLDINTSATTITPSGTTGSVTLTASAALFSATQVGAYFQITHGSTTGYAKITAYTDTTHVTATVIVTLGNTTATDDWYEGAWSGKNGYPKDVKFYENRLYYFSTTANPLNFWGSAIEQYDDFGLGSADDDAVAYSISSAQVDRILWAYPTNVMHLGTAAGPFTASSGSSSSPISATNISVKQQNENGSADVSPVRIGSYVYYVERSGKLIGQLAYNLDTDSYITDNITYLSDHILGDGVVTMALQRYPYNILWCVLDDGTVATLTREQKNDVKGWTRQEIDGFIEDVAVIPNGLEDQVWLIVKRTIDGDTRRYVEYVMPHEFGAQDNAWFVNSGLEYDGTAVSSLSNLDHLEGEEVQILVDGAVHPNKTVTSGAVTLDYSGEHIIIGLGYTSTIKTMDIEAGSQTGSAQAKPMQIGKVTVRLLNSLGCNVGNGTTMDEVSFRDSSMAMDSPPTLFSGDKEVQFPSGHPKNKYIYVTQTQPLPLHVLAIFPKLLLSD